MTPTDSRVEPDGGRKSIGGNVSIALPEVSGEARLPTRSKSQRGERPMSIMSGTTELSRETRRKKKRVPLDVSVGGYRQDSLHFRGKDVGSLS